jgi:hypothetical protein
MSQPPVSIPPPGFVRAANYRRVQLDSVFIGVVNASGTFLPVFLLRMGASANDVGLLTALPAFVALALAIPFGRYLQARGGIVAWYSRLRLVAWSSYAVMAAVAAIVPRDVAIPILLLVWGLAAVPSIASFVAFPLVMDGAAGPGGRFDLLGQRWAIAGVSATIAVALGGQLLSVVAFPTNFEILFVIVSLAGVGSFLQSRRIVVIEVPPAPRERKPAGERLRGLWRLIAENRSFMRFETRAFPYTLAIGLSMPILPLFYVQEMQASNAWIGVIGAASSAGSVFGYLVARQLARRRSASMVLLPSLLAAAIAPAILAGVAWLPAVAVVAFAAGIAGAGAQLALFDQMLRRIPAEHGVTFASVDQSISNLAIVIGPNVGGILAIAIGVRSTLLVVAAVGLAAFTLFLLDARSRRLVVAQRAAEAA